MTPTLARKLRISAAIAGVLLLLLGGTIWWFLRVEDIPTELEPVGDPTRVVIPGIASQPDLRIADLAGKRSFFVFVGIQSWQSDEGRSLNRALNRWILPDDLEGFIIFDARGLGFLQEGAGKYMDAFGKETRFPMYGDFRGAFDEVFKMPQGHHGFVVLGPQSEVLMRRSGGAPDAAALTEIAELLGAQEPPPGPEVPAFAAGSLDQAACAAQPCILLFLDRAVRRSDIPGIEGGFEGEDEVAWKQLEVPAIRMVSSALKLNVEGKARGLVVGEVPGLEPPGWASVPEAEAAAEALGAPKGETTLMILREGRIVFRASGFVPMYRLGEVSDHLGIEYDFED